MYSFLYSQLKYLLPSVALPLIIIVVHFWKKRYHYYYGYKIPGPFSLPLIGSVQAITIGHKGVYKFLQNLFGKYPSVVKLWMATDLYIITTDPHHLKILLTQCLDKGNFYHQMSDYFKRALAAAPIELWRQNRKNINPTFNVTLISTFVDTFAKEAHNLVQDLEKACGKESDDIYPDVWRCTLDAACGTLADVDPASLRSRDFLPGVFRLEEILLQRFFDPILHLDIFWRFSKSRRELISLWRRNCSYIQKIIDLRKSSGTREIGDAVSDDGTTKKRFLDHLVDLNENNKIPHDYVLEESQIMFFVGTETSAVALSSTLLVLGMYPEVQDKIDDELVSIFGNSDRDPTLEDVNKMDYLERVIKETMRLLPPIPFVMRTLDKDLELDGYVFPKGANVIIPIETVHRKPEYYPDPLKFDPDRFLPEEVEKRPPCSYLPFSYGVRNCIGYRYGILSIKVILSIVLRKYRVISSNYKSVEDMDLLIHVVAKPKNGYKITLERKHK